jgi:hypothetical protein
MLIVYPVNLASDYHIRTLLARHAEHSDQLTPFA